MQHMQNAASTYGFGVGVSDMKPIKAEKKTAAVAMRQSKNALPIALLASGGRTLSIAASGVLSKFTNTETLVNVKPPNVADICRAT